jgi:hypothetical protein
MAADLLRLGAWLAHQPVQDAAAALAAGLRCREDDRGWLALADVCLKVSDELRDTLGPVVADAAAAWLSPGNPIAVHWADTGLVAGVALWPRGAHACPLCSGRMRTARSLRAHGAAHGMERIARAAVITVRGQALVRLPRGMYGNVLRRVPAPATSSGNGAGDAPPTEVTAREPTCRAGAFLRAARAAFVRGAPPAPAPSPVPVGVGWTAAALGDAGDDPD